MMFFLVEAFAADQPVAWQVREGDRLMPYFDQQTEALHLTINQKQRGFILNISDSQPFSIFINGQLAVSHTKRIFWNADSVLLQHQGQVLISVYQKNIHLEAALWQDQQPESPVYNHVREGNFFNDFVVLGTLILFAFIVVLIRVNSRLVLDYINVGKLLAIQERDEPTAASRIGSSVNLLFFAFISMCCSFLLLIIFHAAADRLAIGYHFNFNSFAVLMLNWGVLSVIVFSFLMAKLLWVAIFATLFALRDAVRFQFFAFVRQLFVAAIVVGTSVLCYFVFNVEHVSSMYYFLLISIFFLSVGIVLLFLKLMSRAPFKAFQLFSYLCASEIIPLMILMKMLLF